MSLFFILFIMRDVLSEKKHLISNYPNGCQLAPDNGQFIKMSGRREMFFF